MLFKKVLFKGYNLGCNHFPFKLVLDVGKYDLKIDGTKNPRLNTQYPC